MKENTIYKYVYIWINFLKLYNLGEQMCDSGGRKEPKKIGQSIKGKVQKCKKYIERLTIFFQHFPPFFLHCYDRVKIILDILKKILLLLLGTIRPEVGEVI